jgi:Glucodextranase, domain B
MFAQMRPLYTTGRAVMLAGLACLALAFAPSGSAQVTVQPTLVIESISVGAGIVTVTGAVGGTPVTTVAVNGQPVPVEGGAFTASVTVLSDGNAVEIALGNTTYSIPLALVGIVDPLATLREAGISIVIPPEGFQTLDGVPLTIQGKVLDPSSLASLKVNGQEVLGQLNPDGTFSETIPGESETVTVTATDAQGVSQTSTWTIGHVSSVIRTEWGASVSAAGAVGLRVAAIRYVTRGFRASKRIRMVVTVKDSRGYLVRGASVRVRNVKPLRALRPGRYALLTGRLGRAGFWLKPRARVFGRRLVMKAVARTPRAKAQRVKAVRVPALTRAR